MQTYSSCLLVPGISCVASPDDTELALNWCPVDFLDSYEERDDVYLRFRE